MPGPKVYSLDDLANMFGFHKNYIKMLLKQLHVDPELPVEEIDAQEIALKLRRPWKGEQLSQLNNAKLAFMEKHTENVTVLYHMMCVLRERQSSWQLSSLEQEKSRKGIEALQAAVDALSIQVYAQVNHMARVVAVFDIDGTLADNEHRAALLEKRCSACLYQPIRTKHRSECPNCGSTTSKVTQESWDQFLDPSLMKLDTPILPALKVLDQLREAEAEVHFITGRVRRDSWLVTLEWLQDRAGKRNDEILLMREKEDEGIPASRYKARAIDRLKESIGSEGLFIFFEDDPHVFPVYNKHGIVIRCPEGWEHFNPKGPLIPEESRRK